MTQSLMHENTSSARFSKYKIIRICKQNIKHILKTRARHNRGIAVSIIERRNWWRRLFLMSPIKINSSTIKETLENIAKDTRSSVLTDYPSNYAWGTLSVSKRLLRLAQSTNDKFVYVSASDLYNLDGY